MKLYRTETLMCLLAVVGCDAAVEPVSDETSELAGQFVPAILNVEGPLRSPSSGSSFYGVYAKFPAEVLGNCVQNDGAGAYEIYTTSGARIDYNARFLCTVQIAERKDFAELGVRIDQLGHAYYNFFGLDNPDKDSTRYRTLDEGILRWRPSYFGLGANMAPFYWQGSKAGADGYYYRAEVRCHPQSVAGESITLQRVQEECTPEKLREVVASKTKGPKEILMVGIKSRYF